MLANNQECDHDYDRQKESLPGLRQSPPEGQSMIYHLAIVANISPWVVILKRACGNRTLCP